MMLLYAKLMRRPEVTPDVALLKKPLFFRLQMGPLNSATQSNSVVMKQWPHCVCLFEKSGELAQESEEAVCYSSKAFC